MNDASRAQPTANRLGQETSPYLLQHAHNPVDWHPWDEEALERARREDRPILLSVGYSACHWCHVMERESFENAAIAARMNEAFVNIKVDREERPDIDEIYMSAVQAMTGSGGWPLTVFLTPDLRPFYGGTYFPPDDRYGRPGFPRVLEAVGRHYRTQRDQVETQAAKLRQLLEQNADPLSRGTRLDGEDGAAILRDAARQLTDSHDERFGGFAQSGPKFPNHAGLSLLLRYWHDSGDEAALTAATHTLEQMARGGIYDQLGGGFHRYSVDERWLVPHFEKMLYDNALLVPVYVDAWQATGQDRFARVVSESLDYVVREMTAPQGGYAATQDADTEGEEGRSFVWTPEQVEAAIDDEATADLVCRWFDVTPHGNFEGGQSILHVDAELEAQARLFGVTPERLREAIAHGRQALLAARSRRAAPSRDDKVLASWNGLTISAMCRGAQAFEAQRWLASASAAARFCLDELVVDGQLRHAWKDGRAPVPGFQDDYAALIGGLVDLYEASLDPAWLRPARDLAQTMIERFWDEAGGGFYFAEAGRPDLLVRTKNPFDGATPSGNSLAAMALLRLGALTEEARCLDCAHATLAAYADLLRRAPTACTAMACALHQSLRAPLEVTVVGPASARGALLREAHRRYLPRRVIAGADAEAHATTAELIPLLRTRGGGDEAGNGTARAFVCRDATCSAPVTSAPQLSELLAPAARPVPA